MQIRNSARAIILNELGQVLLLKFDFRKKLADGKVIWITPGGGLKERETFEDALRREIFEETGIRLAENFQQVFELSKKFNVNTEDEFISYEKYFFIHVNDVPIETCNFTESEKSSVIDIRWWNIDDLLQSKELFGPDNLANIISDIRIKIKYKKWQN